MGGLTRRQSFAAGPPPYWFLLPVWLSRQSACSQHRQRLPRSFLDDVQWGQYCLFRAVRIRDDLFDGHVRGARLYQVSDLLLIESKRAFARHFSRSSPFWKGFEASFLQTLEGIRSVKKAQRSGTTNGKELLGTYASVCAIFSVSALAVCCRLRCMRHFATVRKFCDAMARAGQLLDDFLDMREDLERREVNAATAFFLELVLASESGSVSAYGGYSDGAVFRRGVEGVFGQVEKQLDVAGKAIHALECAGGKRYLRTYRRSVRMMGQQSGVNC